VFAADPRTDPPVRPQAVPREEDQRAPPDAAPAQPDRDACAAPKDPPVAACPVDHRYGTSVDFAESPTAAAEQALKDNKLLFVLHVAGNFEKDCFT
jgi:hypothetical protein